MRTTALLLAVCCCISALAPPAQSATVQACQATTHWWYTASNAFKQCSPSGAAVKTLAVKYTGAAKLLATLVQKDAACLQVKDLNKCPATCHVNYQAGGFTPQTCNAKENTFLTHKAYACAGTLAAKVFDCLATFDAVACGKKAHCFASYELKDFWSGSQHPCLPSQLKPFSSAGGDRPAAKKWLAAFLAPGSAKWTQNYGSCPKQAALKSFLRCRSYAKAKCTAKAGCYWQTSAVTPGCHPLAPGLNQLIDKCAWNLQGAKCTGLKV